MTLEAKAVEAHVYLVGDFCPLETITPIAEIANRLMTAAVLVSAAGQQPTPVFIELDMRDGRTALVSPPAITAVIPPPLPPRLARRVARC
jgi:hypothetical protein